MRLLNVQAILGIERGQVNPQTKFLQWFNDEMLEGTKYGILSHSWGAEHEEVTLKELENFPKLNGKGKAELTGRFGFQKILMSCVRAHQERLEWMWVDTCCINKESSAELSEAINSMYRWYKNSVKCYALLSDLESTVFPVEEDFDIPSYLNGWPRWFSRGWTLQELLAPRKMEFFNKRWQFLGDKGNLAPFLSKITNIPKSILRYGFDSGHLSAAQVMSWAANRRTTRVEDRAYSLLGLFGVHMPMLYGEGKSAFHRLQLEILRMTNDHTIFAWQSSRNPGSVLADDPSFFRESGNIIRMDPDDFREVLKPDIPEQELLPERLQTCTVTNGGIQIWLPLRRISSSTFEATLACSADGGPEPVVIQVALVKSKYHRYFVAEGTNEPMEFQQLFLAYQHEMRGDPLTFKFDGSALTNDGFSQHRVFPEDVISINHTLTLPKSLDRAVVAYFNEATSTCFAVVVGSCLGHDWAHLVFEEEFCNGTKWEGYAKKVYFAMNGAGLEQAQARHSPRLRKTGDEYCLMKHAHMPRSISGIRMAYRRLPQPNTHSVTLDIVQCTGCCVSNTWRTLDCLPVGDPGMLGHVRRVMWSGVASLLSLDYSSAPFQEVLAKPEPKLGDYGRWDLDNEHFEYEGNIFGHPESLAMGLSPSHPELQLIEHSVRHVWKAYNELDYIRLGHLAVRHPKGLSLPNDVRMVGLLKALSGRLEGKCLVTTVVQGSECHMTRSGNPQPAWPNEMDPDVEKGSRYDWTKLSLRTPLFTLIQPLIWHGEGIDEDVRRYFKEIRQSFWTLCQPSKYPIFKTEAAVDFFTGLFGGGFMYDYIGEIEFFKSLPSLMHDRTGNPSSGRKNQASSPALLEMPYEIGSRSPKGTSETRIATLAEKLIQNLSIGADGNMDHELWLAHQREIKSNAMGMASKDFGVELLHVLHTTYRRASSSSSKPEDRDPSKVPSENDEDEGLRSLAQEITELSSRLDASTDENEQRALEEDITGRILLICWRGVRTEAERLLSKVVDRVVNDTKVEEHIREARAAVLKEVSKMIRMQAEMHSPGGRGHLRRVLDDAEAATSKYALLLATRGEVISVSKIPEPAAFEDHEATKPLDDPRCGTPDSLPSRGTKLRKVISWCRGKK